MKALLAPFQAFVDLWRQPTAEAIAQRQLEDAEREILRHLDAAEYHDAMVVYLETKIRRLKGEDGVSRMAADIIGTVFERNYSRKTPA